jgi:hypothetical protein
MQKITAVNTFLTLALVGGERPASCPGYFTPGETVNGAHWKGEWVGLIASAGIKLQLPSSQRSYYTD